MITTFLRSAPAHHPAHAPTGAMSLDGDRDPVVAQALARLEHAHLHHDAAAAARILDELAAHPTGAWLLHQMAAAGLRALATTAQTYSPARRPA